MPYTINRKIDRKALPLPETHKMVSSPHVNIATLDSNEEKLLQIWKNLLKIDVNDISLFLFFSYLIGNRLLL